MSAHAPTPTNKPTTDTRAQTIGVRVSDQEKQTFRVAAAKAGLTAAQWLRMLGLRAADQERIG